jgi:hypothetical protein
LLFCLFVLKKKKKKNSRRNGFIQSDPSVLIKTHPKSSVLPGAHDLIEHYRTLLALNASRVPAERGGRGSLDPVRLHDPSPEVFEQWAEIGVPMIVSGAIAKWRAGREWDCEWFARNFPEQYVEPWGDANYGAAGKAIIGDVTRIPAERLRAMTPPVDADGTVRAGPTKLKDAWRRAPDEFPSAEEEQRSGAPRKPPSHLAWYWYALNRQFQERAGKTARKLLSMYTPMPSFLRYADTANRHVFSSRMELFMGWPRTGARAHSDPVCEFIASAQFKGTKRWRFALPRDPAVTRGLFSGNETAELLAHSEPVFEVDVAAGEIVVFPPGWIHETVSVEAPGQARGPETCGVSISLQFANPVPLGMLKAFPRRIARTQAHFCFRKRWNRFMFGDENPIPSRRAANLVHAEMDTDGDGAVDCAEADRHFALVRRGRRWFEAENSFDDLSLMRATDILEPSPSDVVQPEIRGGREPTHVILPIMREDVRAAARRFILFNDHNGDGSVSRDELNTTYGLVRPVLKAKNAFLVT